MTLILLLINIISTLAVCLCAGAMLAIREEINDRIDELSMIECKIVKQLPDAEFSPFEVESVKGAPER